MRTIPSTARDALDLRWLQGGMTDLEYITASMELDAVEIEEARKALLWRNRVRTVWQGFVSGLASCLPGPPSSA